MLRHTFGHLRPRTLPSLSNNPRAPLSRIVRYGSTITLPSNLSKLSQQDVEHFATILPKTSILSTIPPFDATQDDLKGYNTDWMDKYHGKSKCVLRPRTTQEVSDILKYCWEKRIAVVPQGGNTGLVGSSFFLRKSFSLRVVIDMNSLGFRWWRAYS